MRRIFVGLIALLGSAGIALGQERFITVACTTSIEHSGLLGYLLPKFTAKTGIKVHVAPLGTGQALDLARRGDADVVFVNDRPAEEKFLAEGWSTRRYYVMHNDLVILGPKSDPAKIAGGKDALAALRKIAATKTLFISRADRSGVYEAELRYWKAAGIDIGNEKGPWYREIGQGMGPALNMASASNAYLLSDRGTWVFFKNRGDLAVMVEGDKRLFNPYGLMMVNPARHPHVKAADAKAFVDWIVSMEGQSAIEGYRIDGQQLYFPTEAPNIN
jgi:tungstate transport system substrate-binding protein